MRAIVFALAVAFPCGVAQASQFPAALILDYSGPPRSGIEAYSEILPGREIGLGPRDRVVILHYGSCRQVAVTGGKVVVSAEQVVVSDAKNSQDSGHFCPQEVSLGTAGSAGVGGEGAQAISARVDCMVIGKRKADVGEVEIYDGGQMLLSVPAQGYRLITAPAAPEMKPGKTYSLVVKGIRGAELAKVPVMVDAAAQDKACLLRLD
ncbi:MAG: hypothetical protein AB7G62_09680 [Magnetospirillum sp.]